MTSQKQQLNEQKMINHLSTVGILGNVILTAFKLLADFRDAGLSAAMDFAGRSMKAQMKQANKANARFVAILGEDEVKESVVLLKDMQTSEQQKVAIEEIVNKLCAEVKG